MDLRNLNETDPVKKNVEKESPGELSPMDPPDPYTFSTIEDVPYENMSRALRELIDEHKAFESVLIRFEAALIKWKEQNWLFDADINKSFREFFLFINEKTPFHNYKEEKFLFPDLRKKLIDNGEHNSNDKSKTAVEILEDEHLKVAQAVAVVFNFLGLASKLNHLPSKEIIFQITFEQGIKIIETMKLHIFMEDKTLFPLAMKLLSRDELITIDNKFFEEPSRDFNFLTKNI
ncbi:MAG: hemerythrin domain-containing protein [Ignavibacteria bacterium]|nr:hemerythrin domain-containing protein [Ignavibacteria bacterium]